MNQFGLMQATERDRMRRSMGVKLLVVCGLALVMTIPALFVDSLISDRTSRGADVLKEISGHVGGPQTFLGPTLAVPYHIDADKKRGVNASRGVYLVFPVSAEATVKTRTEERRRSLFKVPVFKADLMMDAVFDLKGVPEDAPNGAVMEWDRADILVGVSDARGALADARMTIDGKGWSMEPAWIAPDMTINGEQTPTTLTLLGVSAANLAKANEILTASATLQFSGAQRIAVLAYGKTTHVAMQGDWPSPGFDGGFLPVNRSVSDKGFSAEWTVPFIARGVAAEGVSGAIRNLDGTALGVSFVEVADPYQSVNRSLKYLALFLGLVFLSYFIFEVTTGKRVHPAQYVLVGVAQVIFYLLLLSLAERVGFDFAFLIAGTATVMLLATNAGWIFASRMQGLKALGVFGLLYLLIYLLLRLEDDALLVGAIASFLAVAAVMYFTRKIDWYGTLTGSGNQNTAEGAAGSGGMV